jgi:hypothetical protein
MQHVCSKRACANRRSTGAASSAAVAAEAARVHLRGNRDLLMIRAMGIRVRDTGWVQQSARTKERSWRRKGRWWRTGRDLRKRTALYHALSGMWSGLFGASMRTMSYRCRHPMPGM